MTEPEIERSDEASNLRGLQGLVMRKFPWFAKLTSHIPPGQFLRYLLVGTWNTFFGFSLYALFTALLTPRVRFGYMYAAVFSNLIAITVAYFGYKIFVFKTHGNYLVEWFRCLLVYGSGMLPGLVLLPLVVEGLHYGFHLERSGPYVAGALITSVTVIYTFFGHKHFSFRVPDDAARDAATENDTPIEDVAEGIIAQETESTRDRLEPTLKEN